MLLKGERELLHRDRPKEERHPEDAGERSSLLSSSRDERREERWFDEMFKRRFMSMFSRGEEMEELYMPMDVYDDGECIVVKAEIPGIKKEDINVQLRPDSITISGQKSSEQRVESKNYFREERSFGSFSKTCRLPVETVTDSARATFKDGVLEVRILKSEAATQHVKRLNID